MKCISKDDYLQEGLDKRQEHIFKILMRRAQIKGYKKHLSHLIDPNKSTKFRTGRVSTVLYHEVYNERKFDCFFRQVPTKLSAQEQAVYDLTQRLKGVTGNQKEKKITADPKIIGTKETKHAPPGLAAPPKQNLLESHGNDVFFNYIGPWKNGQMSGVDGKYLFADGAIYNGQFFFGRAHGHGEARYANGSTYKGDWQNGLHNGTGIIKYSAGSQYEGAWKQGKRHGHGKLQLRTSGVAFIGHFDAGKFHGHGTWTSPATGISISAQFKRGFINGPLTLIWPNQTKQIFNFHRYGGFTFKQLIDTVFEQKQLELQHKIKDRDAVYGLRYAIQLQNYVDRSRTKIQQERQYLKEQQEIQRRSFIRQKKEKLKQARDAALEHLIQAADQRGQRNSDDARNQV